MPCRGVRGAITVNNNNASEILSATKQLLHSMLEKNNIIIDNISSIFFSVTNDLTAEFPAKAARDLGLDYTPLLCLNEIDVDNGLEKCIRLLMHVNTDTPQKEIHHVYLENATKLRPDLLQS